MPAEPAPVVYVVDDDAAIRETLGSLLRSVGLAMQGFGSTGDFLRHADMNVPSCLVLDVRLPDIGGLEFQRHLKESANPIPIIFITGHGDIPMSVRAIKAGAVEFLPKPFRDQDLLDAIQLAITRDTARRRQGKRLTFLRERYETLSPRERQVMGLLLSGQPNRQIGQVIGASESTVKAHRLQVMRKMQAGSLVELVRMADDLGPILSAP